MVRIKYLAVSASIFAASGCAGLPDARIQYYPAMATTELKVIQTAVSASTTYARWPDSQPSSIPLRRLGSTFADGSGAFGFTEDGRLTSVNAASTGRGEEIVKAGVGLALTMLGVPTALADGGSACDIVESVGDKGVLSIVYSGRLAHDGETAQQIPLTLDDAGTTLNAALRERQSTLPVPQAWAEAIVQLEPPASVGQQEADPVVVRLSRMASRQISVLSAGGNRSEPYWRTAVIVPRKAFYELPIPTASLFGSQTLSLAVAGSGAVTSIGYGTTNGTASAINAANSVLGAVNPSASTAAARAEAEADLIAQQQRLMRCRVAPDACE